METENKTGTTEALITNNGFMTYVSIVAITLANIFVVAVRSGAEQTPVQAFITCFVALALSTIITTRCVVPATLFFFDNLGVKQFLGMVPDLPFGSTPPPPPPPNRSDISIKINGVDVTSQYTNSENGPNSDIVIQGPVARLETSANVTVNGSVSEGVNTSGNVKVGKDVSGGIKADGSVTVSGNVSGGINVDGNVTVNGNNDGNIDGKNVYIGLKNSGSINAEGSVQSKDGIGGSVKADGTIEVNKSVSGSVTSESGRVHIGGDAVVGGDVKADGNIYVYGSVVGDVESENGEILIRKKS